MNQPRLTAGDYHNLTFRPPRLSDTSSAASATTKQLKVLVNCAAEAHLGFETLVTVDLASQLLPINGTARGPQADIHRDSGSPTDACTASV